MTGHCPSPYQIVAIQRLWRYWATFSQKRCPSIGFIFPCRTGAHRQRQACLVDRHCLRSGDIGQPTKCTKPPPWSAVLSWSIFVLLLKRHTGSDTEHHGARAERRNSSVTAHILINTSAPFFFYVSRATSGPARQWWTVPHVAKLDVILPNESIFFFQAIVEFVLFLLGHALGLDHHAALLIFRANLHKQAKLKVSSNSSNYAKLTPHVKYV